MAETPSTMLPLSTPLPDFALPNAVDGATVASADFRDRAGLLVMFICNHCPYVQHVMTEITGIAAEYQPKGIGVVAINANDVETYPQDGPEHMKRLAEEQGWSFPFCFDETQETAKAFRAACTPDFYLFDGDRRLVYRGQLDGSRPKSGVPVTGEDLRAALDALLAGNPAPEDQKPSMGCNIKWTKGREPEYFGS